MKALIGAFSVIVKSSQTFKPYREPCEWALEAGRFMVRSFLFFLCGLCLYRPLCPHQLREVRSNCSVNSWTSLKLHAMMLFLNHLEIMIIFTRVVGGWRGRGVELTGFSIMQHLPTFSSVTPGACWAAAATLPPPPPPSSPVSTITTFLAAAVQVL